MDESKKLEILNDLIQLQKDIMDIGTGLIRDDTDQVVDNLDNIPIKLLAVVKKIKKGIF